MSKYTVTFSDGRSAVTSSYTPLLSSNSQCKGASFNVLVLLPDPSCCCCRALQRTVTLRTFSKLQTMHLRMTRPSHLDGSPQVSQHTKVCHQLCQVTQLLPGICLRSTLRATTFKVPLVDYLLQCFHISVHDTGCRQSQIQSMQKVQQSLHMNTCNSSMMQAIYGQTGTSDGIVS